MTTRQNISILTFLAALSTACAALAPAATQDVKANAERIMITVTTVEALSSQPAACVQESSVTAMVIATQGENLAFWPGDEISFTSYFYDANSPACEGFVGAASPPQLEAEWCGIAYLDQETGSGAWRLAAFGDSLEPFAGKCNFMPPASEAISKSAKAMPATTSKSRAHADKSIMLHVESVQQSSVTATIIGTHYELGDEPDYVPGEQIVFSAFSESVELGYASTTQLQAGWCGMAYFTNESSASEGMHLSPRDGNLVKFDGLCPSTENAPSNPSPSDRGTRMLRGGI